IPSISIERASLLTSFYRSDESGGVSIPVSRAKAFRYLLENKSLCLNEGELIVGERGPAPKATPTYPEICTHSMKDLDILNDREKISFRVDEPTRRTQAEEIIPFWSGRSIRDMIFPSMDMEWIDAYEAGIFTEFQEQRAPGHTVLDDKIYRKGFNDLRKDISAAAQRFSDGDSEDRAQRLEELEAMDIAAEALIMFAGRYADLIERKAEEADPERRAELETMAAICRKVPAVAPDTFWEALQYYWFVHLGVITELNTWDSFNPGRLDQHLLPFYRKGLEDGSLTRETARELLMSFWIKFNNQPAPPKVGVTAEESNTYTDFCLINLGGVDEEGDDAVNEMTYLILDVIEEMRLLQPSSMVQLSSKNPDEYLLRALRILGTGYGQPSIFNTEAIIGEMLRQGKQVVDARRGGASGCVETGAFGRECYILTGYFNIPKVLEITLHDGIDPRTGRRIGLATGDPSSFESFEQLFEAFSAQLRHFIDIKIRGNLVIERLWAENLPAPFMSLLIDDCIEKGMDYNSGGARYNTSYIQGVGLGTISDSLAALKYHVYDRKDIGIGDLIDAIDSDFEGYGKIRSALVEESPKYGNDDDYADTIMRSVFEEYFSAIDGRENWKGGHFRVDMLPTTCHVYFGKVTGALPDGRRAGKPLSEGISPVQGADSEGPTAVLRSAAKFDHLKTGGTLLNQKFTPDIFREEESMVKVGQLVRSYFRMMGHHIQFNVVSADTLRKAQATPEEYRSLIVRVAGYSDYFVDLSSDLQDEIIERTEHRGV
ncbi:MAG TPA: trans-4-hydroxy-L-proline dehydratase, partial [Candidatus Krumholzibacterium sp.]|nr:trans-4-hydroxy-L-proline dehydratase [Candidatus Krumholzibacterium sp.]